MMKIHYELEESSVPLGRATKDLEVRSACGLVLTTWVWIGEDRSTGAWRNHGLESSKVRWHVDCKRCLKAIEKGEAD